MLLSASEFLMVAEELDGKENMSAWPHAFVVNCALAIELFLKGCEQKDFDYVSVKNKTLLAESEIASKTRGHNLFDIYMSLECSTRDDLSDVYHKISGRDLAEDLNKCSDYFVVARYAYEKKNRRPLEIGVVFNCAVNLEKSIMEVFGYRRP